MRSILRIIVAIIGLVLAGPALAATPTCTGNVVIGEGDGRIETHVANRPAGGVGATLDTAIDRYDYDSAGAILILIFAIVMAAEYFSSYVRKWV